MMMKKLTNIFLALLLIQSLFGVEAKAQEQPPSHPANLHEHALSHRDLRAIPGAAENRHRGHLRLVGLEHHAQAHDQLVHLPCDGLDHRRARIGS